MLEFTKVRWILISFHQLYHSSARKKNNFSSDVDFPILKELQPHFQKSWNVLKNAIKFTICDLFILFSTFFF